MSLPYSSENNTSFSSSSSSVDVMTDASLVALLSTPPLPPPYKLFRDYVKTRAKEIDIPSLYNKILKNEDFFASDIIESVHLAMYMIEMARPAAHPLAGSIITTLTSYLMTFGVYGNDPPGKTRTLSKYELLYLVSKVDAIVNHKQTLSGIMIIPPSPTCEDEAKNGKRRTKKFPSEFDGFGYECSKCLERRSAVPEHMYS